ncbi:uncharacterized protein LOC100832290 [Brachypodium distachyon]|uniref:Uncharacterized protein n=1 Tax=Brachypodium distachyon TaxID=15368 RepID=I1J2K4_BRADI|nr:uncharacterized protein LOC100832290 [Brachypodium distachyon]KQJ84955.1 hypothetical protein BRADI_5g23930v3 [Brachypodium distachyon]PNT61994.1 hypothetical protein BRADI_5g23930v3 [Brachypodium distachyon]PNT61995.1 hypothetical protein BRADI_5g23930v3 [Brachypodium distachyon]PNT61996.1 hypothetical protein BRADI_5g23930v3 [Brachypodium distachyon]|eukprot:XP_024311291.1 uncharacterized protein LOC100832290 [Brachypodium distachyon]
MDLLVSVIKRELNKYTSPEEVIRRGFRTIRKVPQHIREVDRSSYEPIVLSIGPYHHGTQALLHMEKEKWKSLDFILKLNCKRSIQDYLKVTAELERQARNCYSEEIKMERKQFIQMLLLDVCFILVKIDGSVITAMHDLNKYGRSAAQEVNDDTTVQETGASLRPVNSDATYVRSLSAKSMNQHEEFVLEMGLCNEGVSSSTAGRNNVPSDEKPTSPCDSYIMGDWYSISAWHDLFLLENQIPFFVIDRIYRFVMDDITIDTSPAEKTSECVEDILRHFPIAIEETERPTQFHHFLHLCHMYLRPSQKTGEIEEDPIRPGYLYHLINFGHNYADTAHGPTKSRQFNTSRQQKDCFQAGMLPSRWRQAAQYHEAGIGLMKREYR